MRQVVILGGGKIGSLIATLLVESNDYTVCVGDKDSHVVAGYRRRMISNLFRFLWSMSRTKRHFVRF